MDEERLRVASVNSRMCVIVTFVFMFFALSVPRAGAQTIYTPYAFTNYAGAPGVGGQTDGFRTSASFSFPRGLAVDTSTNIFVADTLNHTIRKITAGGNVFTFAGVADQSGTNDGVGSSARFNSPYGIAVDSADNIYVADYGNSTIRKITPGRMVTTFAGLAGQAGSDNGSGSLARFDHPWGVAVDNAGSIYVADSFNETIRKITPGGSVSTLAGRAGRSGSADGTTTARFNFPRGVAVDAAGNVYVADNGNSTIRRVTPAGDVSTFAGLAEVADTLDGAGNAARFSRPDGVGVDSAGNVFVTDTGNHTIRRITPAREVTTVAGTAGQTGSADGVGNTARFDFPYAVAIDRTGNLFVVDFSRITKGLKPPLTFDAGARAPAVSNGVFRARLSGLAGSIVVLEASPDLQSWSPLQTNALPATGLEVSTPVGTDQNQFLRARSSP